VIPALLAQIGLPWLVRLVGGALERIDNPVAKNAAATLADVSAAIGAKTIDPAQIAEANRHVEAMAKLDSDDYRETIREVNATIRAEAGSEDPYVRRMRPTFGYVMAATWAMQMAAVAWVIVAQPKEAGEVINALGALSLMWSVGLSVLGVYVYKRSADKAIAAGQEPGGAIAALAERLGGKR
jgi:hypothetical protein